MRTKLAIGVMAVAAAAVAGCSSGGGSASDTSAAGQPAASPSSSTGPATGTAACNEINHTLNTIMTDAAQAKPASGSTMTPQEAQQAKLASNLAQNAKAFTDDQSAAGMTSTLKQAEQTIAANVHSYEANYAKPDSGTYGFKIINSFNQIKAECGTAAWQTAI
jgi:hypothetical protein